MRCDHILRWDVTLSRNSLPLHRLPRYAQKARCPMSASPSVRAANSVGREPWIWSGASGRRVSRRPRSFDTGASPHSPPPPFRALRQRPSHAPRGRDVTATERGTEREGGGQEWHRAGRRWRQPDRRTGSAAPPGRCRARGRPWGVSPAGQKTTRARSAVSSRLH